MSENKITCQICAATCHVIEDHLKEHDGWDIRRYRQQFPDAPVLSSIALDRLRIIKEQRSGSTAKSFRVEKGKDDSGRNFGHLHEIFRLGDAPAALSSQGQPIAVPLGSPDSDEARALVPDIDDDYVFNIDKLKTGISAIVLNKPALFWGHMGAGKTTLWEQICAHLGWPFMRKQHTINTEETHITGQFTAENGTTKFQLGPLALAMQHGYVYCADEYDFALPHVLSIYQPVLEGKPLMIGEAGIRIRPHRDFRFVATGNTNGTGDDTGLYQGAQLQNAANYERFAIVERIEYMQEDQEIAILMAKTNVKQQFAASLVELANRFRASYERRELSVPISPRSLLNAVEMGLRFGDMTKGFRLAYVNRLDAQSAKTALDVLQRAL